MREQTKTVQLPPSESIVENIANGFFIINRDWFVTYVNASMGNWVGKSSEEMVGRNLWELFPASIDTDFYKCYHKAMDEQVAITFEEYYEPTQEWLEIRLIPTGQTLIGYAISITERKRYEKMIEHIAYHDGLTELPNRRSFEKKLEQMVELSSDGYRTFALLILDIDRFKQVNDTLGHQIGDQLIKQFSERLVQHAGPEGLVARMGSDEFAIVLDSPHRDDESMEKIVKSLIHHIEDHPFRMGDYKLHMTVSIGVSYFPHHGSDASTLLKHSESALNRAKEKGRNHYEFYHPMMNIESYKRFTLERDLRIAIEQNQLELYFQPRVHAKTTEILSAESLLRWNHTEWGVVSPVDFIPLAEQTGLIIPLSKWVERAVCRQIGKWREEGISLVPISINVSAQRLLEKSFVQDLQNTMKEFVIEGKEIEIEITETSILDNQKLVQEIISELKELGVIVALDDFGKGYSSLAYLTQYQAETLKIDKSFMRDVSTSRSKGTVVQAIIGLAHGLGMRVVAEGVETKEQLMFLQQQDCDEIQGYLFSQPLPAKPFAELLRKQIITPAEEYCWQAENKRRYVRVDLVHPLRASMTIVFFKDKGMSLGKTEVLIENLGGGGLRFLSHLRLDVNADILYEIETVFMGKMLQLRGCIVSKQEIAEPVCQYGLEFVMTEAQRASFVQSLMQFASLLEEQPLVPQCDMITMDRYAYMMDVAMHKPSTE